MKVFGVCFNCGAIYPAWEISSEGVPCLPLDHMGCPWRVGRPPWYTYATAAEKREREREASSKGIVP